jgi:hypothetical protein
MWAGAGIEPATRGQRRPKLKRAIYHRSGVFRVGHVVHVTARCTKGRMSVFAIHTKVRVVIIHHPSIRRLALLVAKRRFVGHYTTNSLDSWGAFSVQARNYKKYRNTLECHRVGRHFGTNDKG